MILLNLSITKLKKNYVPSVSGVQAKKRVNHTIQLCAGHKIVWPEPAFYEVNENTKEIKPIKPIKSYKSHRESQVLTWYIWKKVSFWDFQTVKGLNFSIGGRDSCKGERSKWKLTSGAILSVKPSRQLPGAPHERGHHMDQIRE